MGGLPCSHPAKNFGQAIQALENQAFWHGHAARTSTKNFGLKNFAVTSGGHWTGSPNKRIDKIGKNCQKMSEILCFQPLQTIFRTFFRHFSDILSTFPFSGLSNDLPVTKLRADFLEGTRLMVRARNRWQFFADFFWLSFAADSGAALVKTGFWTRFSGFSDFWAPGPGDFLETCPRGSLSQVHGTSTQQHLCSSKSLRGMTATVAALEFHVTSLN